ncbi:MAG: LapA family protein [Moraxella sp.]|nr:LapA family protein [Moraxella sp.]
MPIILVILLVAIFGYSLVLVIMNNSTVALNLMFANVPAINLGLVLIMSMMLGVIIGLLLGLMMFRVFQMRFEIGRLKKESTALKGKLDEANIVIEQNRKSHILSETSDGSLTEQSLKQSFTE